MKFALPARLALLFAVAFYFGTTTSSAQLAPGSLIECGFLLDFESAPNGDEIPAGLSVTEQWAGLGVHISAKNNNSAHPSKAIIFDSANPTGGDWDLGTPASKFGGKGRGEGGLAGEGTNVLPLNKVLIIAENDVDADRDGLVDDPDDEAGGGTLRFDFDDPVEISTITLLDIDKNEASAVFKVHLSDGDVKTMPISGLGDNSVFDIEPHWKGVKALEIILPGSGSLAAMQICP